MTPLTVPEARAILIADEALDRTFKEREASGQTLGIEEIHAWMKLVENAHARIAEYERLPTLPTPYPGGNEPDAQTLMVEAAAASDARRSKL